MLYTRFGGEVRRVLKCWKTMRDRGDKKPHAMAQHWHADCLVYWPDTKNESVLKDICAPGGLYADEGWKEIDETLGRTLESKGVEPLGVGL